MGITDLNKPLTAGEVPAARKSDRIKALYAEGRCKVAIPWKDGKPPLYCNRQILLDAMAGRCEKYCQVMEANESKGYIRTLEPGEIDDGAIESWVPTLFFCSERRQRHYQKGG